MQTAAPIELASTSFLNRFFPILLARLVINSFHSQHKSLAEWQRFAASREGRWDCPPVGLVLQFADWLRELRRLAPSSIKVMLSGVAGAVAAAKGTFPLASPLV